MSVVRAKFIWWSRLGCALALGLGLGLSAACSPVGLVVGAGATAGIAAAQERGLAGVARDTATKGKVLHRWVRAEAAWTTALGVDVHEGRALLTGTLDDPAQRDRALHLAWQVDGVRAVLNEIQLTGPGQSPTNVGDLSRDTWIATKLKAALTMAEDILAINYTITVHDRRVYILGIAQDQAELDRVIALARRVSAVRRVVPHVRVKAK